MSLFGFVQGSIPFEQNLLDEICEQLLDDKFYVDSKDITLTEDGIYLWYKGVFLSVAQVGIDSLGIYVAGVGRTSRRVKCPDCGLQYDPFGQSSVCPHYDYAPYPQVPMYVLEK